ncbi:hypothetical protein EYF80_017697 [Liparis tanakae]|uniref:Uncharacterized protein n=1 Tax=Liparis tanakae TaxID=230148 RepID=A0A4Z2I2R4_9TELE|nr:hypothetical protein EYF80_017697 [Liparis tanakae]
MYLTCNCQPHHHHHHHHHPFDSPPPPPLLNAASFSYILTPAFPPPTAFTVHRSLEFKEKSIRRSNFEHEHEEKEKKDERERKGESGVLPSVHLAMSLTCHVKRSTLTSVPSSKDTRQVMTAFASPAAGMCVVARWASRKRVFSACFRMERRPSVLRRKLSMMGEREGYTWRRRESFEFVFVNCADLQHCDIF